MKITTLIVVWCIALTGCAYPRGEGLALFKPGFSKSEVIGLVGMPRYSTIKGQSERLYYKFALTPTQRGLGTGTNYVVELTNGNLTGWGLEKDFKDNE